MNCETMKRVMEALAGVAEAVGTLRALFPAGSDVADEVAQSVCEMADGILEGAMLGPVGSPERTGKAGPGEERTPNVQLSTLNAQVKSETGAPKTKGRGGMPKKTAPRTLAENAAAIAAKIPKVPEPGEGEKPAQVMRVCPDCGESYLRTGNGQKRCPACADKKQKQLVREFAERKRLASAPDNRLAKIKEANERLDRIPDRE
jgi:hypothetical protein